MENKLVHAVQNVAHALGRIADAIASHPHPPKRGTLSPGIGFIHIEKELRMQTLPPHKSINVNHAVLLLSPLDGDGNPVALNTLGTPTSSDDSQSTASLNEAGTGFDLSTPLESGSVHYTFTPPDFDGLEFDFSYAPKQVGHLNPSFGDDVPDTA